MPLHKALPSDLNEVDVIIAGGGTAGCIIAARLSDADPTLSILVLESGAHPEDDPTTKYPLLFLIHMDPTSKSMKGAMSQPSEQLGGRGLAIAHGNVLGGGSTVNMMTYSRPYRFDFDTWDMPGWKSEDVIPYFKKFEKYHGPGKDDVHGKDGPIEVSDGPMVILRTQDDFIAASNKVGFPLRDDVQDFENAIGVQRNLQYVSPNGERQDVANKYILPRLEDGKHQGLHVVVSTRVEKVLFDESKRAVGVVCKATAEGSKPREIRAKRQVVLSAGTFGSSTILQRSGIGSADLLKKVGVPLVVENSAVGEDFQEHLLNLTAYHSDLEPEETMDALHLGKYDVPAAIANNDPFLGWTGMDTICQIRPTDDEVAALGDDFKEKFSKYWGNEPRKVMGALCGLNSYPGVVPSELQGQQYFGTTAFATYPFSRGYIHITGRNDSDPIDFKTGFFEDEGNFDIKTMRYLYKTQREIVRRMALYRGEVAIAHPTFPTGSSAAVHSGALTGEIKNLEYTKEDDDAIDEWVRKTVGTAWHGIGSCKMGRREKGGVVDGDLNVYGAEGLKVADLSIVGGNVAANTNSTALMIGEKAADIVIKDLGLIE